MVKVLRNIIARNRAGTGAAIPSVCTAHPDVLRACLARAETLDRSIVVEATSNQVNQFGGYTGIQPAGFIRLVHELADEAGVERGRIIFGGDHLGPQAWRSEPADTAMEKARDLVDAYVRAGFRKIHLDCSEGCAGEAGQLGDAVTAERSADLARVCLHSADGAEDLLFVIGTEVPPPGGARVDEDGAIPPTQPDAARATLAAHNDSFGDMAPLIGGLVVQPGVEFGPDTVHDLPMDRDPELAAVVADQSGVCLEAHSTDYQSPDVYPRLAQLGFAFQKVGPALTYAYRAALYQLDALRDRPALKQVMEALMTANPQYWQGHYHGDADRLARLRHDGLADRIRYYWAMLQAQAAVAELLADVDSMPTHQVMTNPIPDAVLDRAEALSGSPARRIVDAYIQLALDPYFFREHS